MIEKGGLDLGRFHSLWKSTVQPDLLEVKDILNIMFPRAFFGGDEQEDSDDDTNLTQAACSSAGRDDSRSHQKRHRVRYFDPTLKSINATVGASRFQDTLIEFRGKRAHQMLSSYLSTFEEEMDEYEEMKDYFDPVFPDDVYKSFRVQENVSHVDSMEVLDGILSDLDRDLPEKSDFECQDDFVSLVSSKMCLTRIMNDSDEETE